MTQHSSNIIRHYQTVIGQTFLLIAVLGFAGCETFSKVKVDNPVLGPPPPRLTANDEETPSDAPTVTSLDEHQTDIRLATTSSDIVDKVTEDSQVVATVNGEPIFAADLLEPFQGGLQKAQEAVEQGKFPAEVLEKQKYELMAKSVDGAIERKLLEQGLKKTLKKEQRDMIEVFLDQYFQQEAQRMMAKDGIQTMHEFDEHLKQNGYSLSALRSSFEGRIMAQEYLRAKRGDTPKLTREQLMSHYEKNISEYTNPERVKWQFLLVEYKKHGGRQGAYAVLNKAVQELKEGADFTEVVKKYSDSATRHDGGMWANGDWTTPGSLSDEKVEKALFEMPVGSISSPFESDTEFKLIKVVERQDSTVTPFDKVQNQIETSIVKNGQDEATKKVMDELYETAVIESIFDQKEEVVAPVMSEANPFSTDGF
ncbi:peptidylprolyl isomerase [Polystyrenella longa]|uniref:Peptidylprolyl isomerase n=1 Tax=Polystyrenella longa TaxID=2528007 RepID=A0A518CR87_9PLAN|nr:peptidyl-prolyl cis-trans isomerase [Polystyrenella longa]QDU81714.1 peptidylprolyl isomerase [Polystyrenella longa]